MEAVITKCATCPNMMRPYKTSLFDYPNTTPRAGKSCGTCSNRKHRGQPVGALRATGRRNREFAALDHRPIPDITPEQRARVHSLADALGGDDATMLVSMLLDPVLS